MRRKSVILSAALLSCLMIMGSIPASAEEAAEVSQVKVSALATMEQPYHQVTALFIEYPDEVVNPKASDFMVMDYQTFCYSEVYEKRPYQEGVIKDVYANDVPEIRADKTSEDAKHGKYVVIELEPVKGSYYDEEASMWRPDNIAGIATVRIDGQTTDHFRTDWSLYVVSQLNNLYNADGEVVAKRGILPTMEADAIATPEMEMFTQESITAENGTHEIYFNLRLPSDYDESKTYPIVFCQPGAGGRIQYKDQDEDGNFIDIGANSTRDGLPVNVARYDDQLIVVTVQPWLDTPEEWEVDNVADYIQLVNYVLDNYSVDTSRVYGMGNSMGTMITSQALTREPNLLSAYAQCNGCYYMTEAEKPFFTIFNDETSIIYDDATEADLMKIAANPENRKDAEEIAALSAPLDALVENEVPVYCFDGVNTEVIGPFCTISVYTYLKEAYEAKGYTEEQIDQLVRMDLADKDEFLELGVCEFHESTKIITDDKYDVLPWLLSKTREIR